MPQTRLGRRLESELFPETIWDTASHKGAACINAATPIAYEKSVAAERAFCAAAAAHRLHTDGMQPTEAHEAPTGKTGPAMKSRMPQTVAGNGIISWARHRHPSAAMEAWFNKLLRIPRAPKQCAAGESGTA